MTEPAAIPRPVKATPFQFRSTEEIRADMAAADRAAAFNLDLELGYLDLYWGGYEYSVELAGIDSPQKLLAFLSHILAKQWDGSTGKNVGRLIRALSRHFNWQLHGVDRSIPAPRTTSAAEERSKLTPALRYEVLHRDDFRCRACGYTVEQGAHLHIDHIIPIVAGGRTEFNNLQALCSGCNLGKGARR
jgi:hypothetical protein